MGNTHNKQEQQHHQETNMVVSSSSSRSLLPLLCSRKSVNITADEDPLSPKLGCMGQLKMNHNHNNKRSNRVSTHQEQQQQQVPSNVNYSTTTMKNKKKLFSGKNLILSSATASTYMNTTAAVRSNSWVGPRSSITINKPSNFKQQHQFNFIREMDPPLPVVMVTSKTEDEGGHVEGRSSVLWKRRFGDVSCLETLDLNRLNTVVNSSPPQPLSV